MPRISAMAALNSRERSSARCSSRGIRPSGLSRRFARMYCSPTMRAPVTALGFLAMPVRPPSPSKGAEQGLLGLLRVGRSAGLGDRLLEVAQLPLQRVDLRLRVCRLRGLDLGGRREGRGGRLGLRAWLLVVHLRDLSLQDAHRLAEGPGRVGQLARTEQHDDHDRDDHDLPGAVKQVSHLRSFSARGRVQARQDSFRPRVYTAPHRPPDLDSERGASRSHTVSQASRWNYVTPVTVWRAPVSDASEPPATRIGGIHSYSARAA